MRGAHLAPTSRAFCTASWPAQVHAQGPEALPLAWQRQGVRAFASAPAAAEAPAESAAGAHSVNEPVQLTDTAVQVIPALRPMSLVCQLLFLCIPAAKLLLPSSSARRSAAIELEERLEVLHHV